MIKNILAERYASTPIKELWSGEGRIILEREFWIAVMKSQRELGLDISAEAISAYEQELKKVNLDSIMERERITRHDVKARIEEFNDLAGHQHIHKGMTSRDLTENVEQLQVFRSLQLIRVKGYAALNQMAELAEKWEDLIITARTHNVAAQQTTLGKRIAMFGEELLLAMGTLESLLSRYTVRGLKGAVGTQMDQISLFNGNTEEALNLEEAIAKHLGIPHKWINVGQVYPRSLDYEVISVLNQLSSAPSSFAKTLRLMAGHETASEGFAPGQTGSSAMPHKMNSRSCERVNGFATILSGYLTMASGLSGDQWNEGDVSCSVVRRVMLPDAFFALDGLLETFLTILNQMDAYASVIDKENTYYRPFLLTTSIMMEAVKAGMGREEAHGLIKKHAVATVEDLRTGKVRENDLLSRLIAEEAMPLGEAEISQIEEEGSVNVGLAREQVKHFTRTVREKVSTVPEARDLQPESIL